MRPQEYLGLKWADVNFVRKTVSVRRALVETKGGGFSFEDTKTASSRRILTISGHLMDALKAHRRVQLEHKMKLGPDYADSDLVFANLVGSPLYRKNLTDRHYKKICLASGVPTIRLHDLRHTTATLLLCAQVHPKVVQERLGHSSIAITLDTYSHVIPNMQQSATDELEKIISRLG